MKKISKKVTMSIVAIAIACSMIACGDLASSADFSQKAVTCIVPYEAGGGTDTVMRALADATEDSFESITIENYSGLGGVTGMLAGANAKNDGTTITMITVDIATLEAMGTNQGLVYSQFKPIMMINSACSAITVKADDARFTTLEDLIAYSREKELHIGNSGRGTIWHLAAAGLAKEADTNFAHVAYEGAAGAISGLVNGEIDAVAVSYAEVAEYVERGELKVLAVMSDDRLESIPDVPTCKECGYAVVLGTWRGLGVPADTSQKIVDELYRIFIEASKSEGFVEAMDRSNNVIEIMDGETFNARIASDLEMYTSLVKELGLRD